MDGSSFALGSTTNNAEKQEGKGLGCCWGLFLFLQIWRVSVFFFFFALYLRCKAVKQPKRFTKNLSYGQCTLYQSNDPAGNLSIPGHGRTHFHKKTQNKRYPPSKGLGFAPITKNHFRCLLVPDRVLKTCLRGLRLAGHVRLCSKKINHVQFCSIRVSWKGDELCFLSKSWFKDAVE